MSARLPFLNPLVVLDDRALLTRFTEQHDQTAFEQLVKRHGRLVFGVCRRVVRDAHLAEDAFQATFLVLARNPTGAATASSVGGWLFGVARRVGLAARRHEQRRERRELQSPPREGGSETPASDFNDLLCVLDEELCTLPDDTRAALVACFLEERTQDEAARELGWSLSTLRRRLERGKELLRERLARRGVALGAGLLTGGLAAPARATVPAFWPSPRSSALANELLQRGIGFKLSGLVAATVLAIGGLAYGFTNEREVPPAPGPDSVQVSSNDPGEHTEPAPAARAAGRKPWVALAGRVVFPKGREVPNPRLVPPEQIKDADVWKPFAPLVVEDVLVDTRTRGVANVVVWLRPDSDDKKAEFPHDKVYPDLSRYEPHEHTVLAVGGQFRPRVLAFRAGDTITFENRLPVPTNVMYSVNQTDDEARHFNVLVGKDMAHSTKPLPVLRAPDSFRSNIYPWMTGHAWAFDHPYFAVTDGDGRFEIKNAPVGVWRLVVWHEAVGYLGGAQGRLGTKVTVSADRSEKHAPDPLEFASDNWPAP